MEEKKFDVQSLIGFLLIGGLLIWMLYNSSENEQNKKDTKQTTTEQVQQSTTPTPQPKDTTSAVASTDSVAVAQAQQNLGAFGYSSTLPSAQGGTTNFSNDVLELKVDNKGGYISEAKLKKFKTFDSIPVYLIHDGNASFNINFTTSDGRVMNTKDMYFQPSVTSEGNNKILSMKLKVSEDEYLEYRYTLKPGEYMMDFSIKSKGLTNVFNPSGDVNMEWDLKGYRHSKSISYENRYTKLNYLYGDGEDDDLGLGKTEDEVVNDVHYLAYTQHFFSSILLTDTAFKKSTLHSENLVENEDVDTTYTKSFSSAIALERNNGELNYKMNWYYGPTDYKLLKSYDRNLDEIVPLGWGIFAWINKHVFIPFFAFLSSFLPYGIAIVVMTIVVRIVLSPVTYKSYLSQAKMKILKPEINELNEKYKDNAMKKQQETMKLYSKAGASPMSGCLPALLQIPVFYALFRFFPSAIQLRQKGFLWADDLSSYDTVAQLPFKIPFYGDHVSLFPILASVAIFFYMQMTTGQSMQTQQSGMPNMKFLMYLSPLMMLFFFNNYASGLSLYYFTSNLITIGIMLVIKHVIIDEAKIHAKIQANKKKPKKQSKFSKKMQEMMEQAEKQKKQ